MMGGRRKTSCATHCDGYFNWSGGNSKNCDAGGDGMGDDSGNADAWSWDNAIATNAGVSCVVGGDGFHGGNDGGAADARGEDDAECDANARGWDDSEGDQECCQGQEHCRGQ
mmetsp:Transcript_17498/g.37822  ORF Transcript_17498/g.37822 Transcript_17498/m.37822 type:complete len:112 (+) Transcript_17498:249-584(+)